MLVGHLGTQGSVPRLALLELRGCQGKGPQGGGRGSLYTLGLYFGSEASEIPCHREPQRGASRPAPAAASSGGTSVSSTGK